ncbi:MAG TPA: patatin-like phospholipase family protein [Candidatus Paceibacterota bacterium]
MGNREKLNSRETGMRFEGNPDVLVNLFRKQALLDAGDPRHTEIRTGLYVGSGGMKGVVGGGQVTALEKAGLKNVFDVAYGSSTGANAIAYFLAGQAELGTSIYYEECTSSQFLSFGRALRREKAMRIQSYLMPLFTHSAKKLNTEAIRRSRTDFRILVTDPQNAESTALDGRKVSDIVAALGASSAAPCVSDGPVLVDGRLYQDGGATPSPIADMIREHHPTDMLIFPNCPEHISFGSRLPYTLLDAHFLSGFPTSVQKRFAKKEREKIFQEDLTFLRMQKECRYLIIWPNSRIHSSTQNAPRLYAAAQGATKHLTGLLAEAKRYSGTGKNLSFLLNHHAVKFIE